MKRQARIAVSSGSVLLAGALGSCSAESGPEELNRERYQSITRAIGMGGVWMVNGALYGPVTQSVAIRPLVSVGEGENASVSCDNEGESLRFDPNGTLQYIIVNPEGEYALPIEYAASDQVQTLSRTGQIAINCIMFDREDDVFVNDFPQQGNFDGEYLDIAKYVSGGVQTMDEARQYLNPQLPRL